MPRASESHFRALRAVYRRRIAIARPFLTGFGMTPPKVVSQYAANSPTSSARWMTESTSSALPSY